MSYDILAIEIDISLVRQSFLTIFSQKQSFFQLCLCVVILNSIFRSLLSYSNFVSKFSNKNNIINSPFRICIKVDKLL